MLERSFHLSSFTDSGVQRNRDAGRWNRKGERGGGREEEAEKIINHSHDCVAPLLVLFIRADTLGSGPHCILLLLSSIKSTVSQSSAEPTVSVNMFLFQEILLKIEVIACSGLGVTKQVICQACTCRSWPVFSSAENSVGMCSDWCFLINSFGLYQWTDVFILIWL